MLVLVAAPLALALSAAAAGAATFYVNQLGGSDANPCSKAAPCKTIEHTIVKARTAATPNTIEVEDAGNYEGQKIQANETTDKGLTINAEPGVVVSSKTAGIVVVGPAAGTVTLTGFKFVGESGGGALIEAGRAGLVLKNDEVADTGASASGSAIEVVQGTQLTMDGGTIEMEGSAGYGVSGLEGSSVTLEGVRILNGLQSGDEAGGVNAVESALSMSDSTVAMESGSNGSHPGINAEQAESVSLSNDTVKQSNLAAAGVLVKVSPLTVNGLTIEMANSSSKRFAFGLLNTAGASTVSKLEVNGKWVGLGADVLATKPLTVADSSIVTPSGDPNPAMLYSGAQGGSGLLIQRSVLSSSATAPESLNVLGDEGGTNATLDSSEVLGGLDGIRFLQTEPGATKLTVSASTIDANQPGTAEDAPGVSGIYAQASTKPGASATVAIQGSIVLEKQTASVEAGDSGGITCAYSAVPSQVQAAGSGSGAIACASGTNGNTEVNPLSSLFPEPLSGYQLSPSSSAVDSVPASAVVLPFGYTSSATDLAGNPRVVDGNGDCVAVQDKGALELQGHAAACKPVVTSGTGTVKPATPAPPALGALTIAPGAFAAATKGATVSRKSKRSFGAKVTFTDSEAATTTFTVFVKSSGRTQGHSCKKPSRHNKHGKRCALYIAAGTFTHTDVAGANSFHFSGRLKGRKLAKGSYRLQAVAENANGTSAPATATFKIK